MSRDDGLLPSLTRAFKSLDAQAQVNTQAFVEAVASILPVFDDLGKSQPLQCPVWHCQCSAANRCQAGKFSLCCTADRCSSVILITEHPLMRSFGVFLIEQQGKPAYL